MTPLPFTSVLLQSRLANSCPSSTGNCTRPVTSITKAFQHSIPLSWDSCQQDFFFSLKQLSLPPLANDIKREGFKLTQRYSGKDAEAGSQVRMISGNISLQNTEGEEEKTSHVEQAHVFPDYWKHDEFQRYFTTSLQLFAAQTQANLSLQIT